MTVSTRLLPQVSLLAIAATLAFPQISAARAAEGQQSGDAAAEEKAEAAEIVVTGSSLKGVAPVGSNLISVSADAIEKTNAQTVQQILRSVPAVVGLGSAGQGSFNSASQSGTNAPTIHGLGGSASNSTLNIVDGHRIPLSGVNHSLGDPNMVPVTMIERVEVLAEGASSIYGSDAVAGVINFITRRKFDGLQTSGQMGFGDDYRTYQVGFVAGTSWENGWVTVGYNYSDRSRLKTASRSFLGADQRQRAADAGLDVSSATAQNRANFSSFNCDPASVQPGGTTTIFRFANGSYGNPVSNAQSNAFCDINQIGDQLPEERRHNVMMKAEQQVGDKLTIGGDILYSNRKNNQQVSRGQGGTGGGAVLATVFGPGSTPAGGAGQINPFYVAMPGQTSTTQQIRFSGDELFGPGAEINSGEEHFFVNARAEYELTDAWSISALALIGNSSSFVRDTGRLNQSAALLALNGTTNQGGSLTTISVPATGVIVTQLPLTTANALDVWNIGTANRTSAAVRARLTDTTTYRFTRQGIQNYRLQAAGELFDLPGGAVQVAVGGEYIGYTIRQNAAFANGTGPSSSGSTTINLDYSRNVKAAYAEVLLPFIGPEQEIPGIYKLELNLAGRVDEYSDFGSTTNPKIAASWEPVRGIRVRGNWSKSFVAPALTSFGADGRGTTAETSIAGGPANLAVPIAAYPGVNTIPGIACTTTACTVGTPTIQGLQINGGNSDLVAQKGTSWALGVDFTPSFAPGLRLSATFWNNEFTGGVTAPASGSAVNITGLQPLLQIFPNGATPAQLAEIIGNRPLTTTIPGSVRYVYDFRQRNVLNLKVQGIDADVRYSRSADWGSYSVGAAMSLKTKFDQNFGGGPTFSVLNTTGFNGTFPSIRLDLRGDVGVKVGDFAVDLFVNHTGGYRNFSGNAINPVVSVGGVPTGAGGDPVKAYTTFDTHLAYTLPEGWMKDGEVFLDVQNLFNVKPSFYNNAQGYDTFAGNPILRVISVGVRTRF
ncbi:TonB-dependent receptor domain-containing protein [Sandarakinorhabdus sp.]|jgi:iron complex outermembrane receptor protein|uniref:TonB-dependent receptor domain-containing protein n=1 Tax=Sandarakinorhabdus sp. TaxID=1916663 RepID=UPI0028B1D1F3|nr:TonB-dependent receptor [Sandarakinorhabdus sp.]